MKGNLVVPCVHLDHLVLKFLNVVFLLLNDALKVLDAKIWLIIRPFLLLVRVGLVDVIFLCFLRLFFRWGIKLKFLIFLLLRLMVNDWIINQCLQLSNSLISTLDFEFCHQLWSISIYEIIEILIKNQSLRLVVILRWAILTRSIFVMVVCFVRFSDFIMVLLLRAISRKPFYWYQILLSEFFFISWSMFILGVWFRWY